MPLCKPEILTPPWYTPHTPQSLTPACAPVTPSAPMPPSPGDPCPNPSPLWYATKSPFTLPFKISACYNKAFKNDCIENIFSTLYAVFNHFTEKINGIFVAGGLLCSHKKENCPTISGKETTVHHAQTLKLSTEYIHRDIYCKEHANWHPPSPLPPK